MQIDGEKPKVKPVKAKGFKLFSGNLVMSMPKDSLKCIQDAWYKMLVDFRAWYMPETVQTDEWKQRNISTAIKSCPSRLMDDSESMLAEYRKSQNADLQVVLRRLCRLC